MSYAELGFESFEDWRKFPVPAEITVAPLLVQIHAWHLDQSVFDPDCKWCNPKAVER